MIPAPWQLPVLAVLLVALMGRAGRRPAVVVASAMSAAVVLVVATAMSAVVALAAATAMNAAADLEEEIALNAVVVLAEEIGLSGVVALVAATALNAMALPGSVVTGLIPTAGPVAVLIVLAATTVLIAVAAPIAPTAAGVQLPGMAGLNPTSIANRKPRA